RCLERDPRRRLRDIGDAMAIIEVTPEVQPASPRLTWTLAAAAALLLGGLAVVSFLLFHQALPEARPVTTSINAPEHTTFELAGSVISPPALSPDGRLIVFRARAADGTNQLWVRSLDSPTAQPLVGTDNAQFPFWSPDSRSVAFMAEGKLKRLDVTGGPP